MAEIVMNLVLGKLAEMLFNEANFLSGVRDKVEKVQRDLTWIQSFLKDADKKRHKDERVKCWVNEVKEIGYLIEDTLDKFFMEAAAQDSTLKKIGKLPMKLVGKHKLGTEIDKIQRRITEIAANTTKYAIEGLKDDSTVSSSKRPVKPIVIPELDKTEVVGFEVDIKAIVDQLIDTNVMRRSVISVVGAGGCGRLHSQKRCIRAEIKSHFAVRQWVTVSEEYKLKDILIKMLEGIGELGSKIRRKAEEMQERQEEHIIRELHNYMKERKYLVVLDDVWSGDLWPQLQDALPEITNGSRVLMTTRSIMIAEEADAISHPYEIKPLNKEKSRDLLLKKIFPNQHANECPEDLLPLAPQFAQKCGGWPLALVVLGGILSRKIPNYNTWDEVMRNIDWHTDGSKCIGVISTSYDDLPIHLKSCFMCFAAFPEDYQIKASTLVQLWVAEGFIAHHPSKIMEDIGESYLEELVQRCMVQVSSRYVSGKIKYCHVHDLLREVAIQKAKEDNFLQVFTKNGTPSSPPRRMAINYCGSGNVRYASTNLRSLHYFNDSYYLPSCERFGMLRVLNVHRNKPPGINKGTLDTIWLMTNEANKWLKDLTSLRYFEDKGTDNFMVGGRHGNRGVFYDLSHLAHLKYLQTVNLYFCTLPESFWENKLLRHVIFSAGSSFIPKNPPEGPPSSADLRNLLTLKEVCARKEWGAKVPHFPQLRKLGLTVPSYYDQKQIINSLSNLQDLSSLSLKNASYSNSMFSCGTVSFRSNQHLYSLCLKMGTWPKQEAIECGNMFPPHLVKLTLQEFSFEDDPMPQLEKLQNLKVLKLLGKLTMADGNQRIVCSKRGFTRLQQLILHIIYLEEWKIEEGAMPLLNQLQLRGSKDLKMVPDLQYLAKLRELEVTTSKSKEEWLRLKLQGDDQWKIKHISFVSFN